MRVYELAKELGLASKDCVTKLNAGGLAVGSHMTVLSDAELVKARAILQGPAAAPKAKAEDTPEKHSAPVSKPQEEEKKASKVPVASSDSSKKETVKKAKTAPSEQILAKPWVASEQAKAPVQPAAPSNPTEKNPFMTEIQKAPAASPMPKPTVVAPSGDARPTLHGRALEDMVPNLDVLEEVMAEVFPTKQEAPKGVKGQEKFTRIFSEKKGRNFRRGRNRYRHHHAAEAEPEAVTEITVAGPMRLGDVATALGKPASELIMSLLKKGMVCNINNVIPVEKIKELAAGYGVDVAGAGKEASKDAAPQHTATTAVQAQKSTSKEGATRYPIAVVMGHVDHGKTTFLDYVRKKNVAAGEKGGITQHLGAYEVHCKSGTIVFLDTPGHEAFSYIRKQGAKITDIVILMVAADDGIKPQTVEAIKHAKEAGVPIIVAINKIDKVKSSAAIETVKRQLSQYDLMTEDWGGDVVCVPISAKTGEGVEDLLDMVVLQSQMMDLRARRDAPAKVFILESHVEKGFGPVATGIALEGVLRQGDQFICGQTTGRVRLLIDSHGNRVKEAGPAVPVQIVGFDNFSAIGDWLYVGSREEYEKMQLADVGAAEDTGKKSVAPQQDLIAKIGAKPQAQKFINLVIKTDTRGSKEALSSAIDKLMRENKEINCPIRIISSGIGDISESDVELAMGTGAYLVGLHVKVEKNAQLLARDKEVNVHLYQIIYQLVEFLQAELLKRKEIKISWEKCAELVVRKVFDIKGVGVIAGCYVREGVVAKGYKAACVRGGKTIGEAKINSLQRDKKTVKEVHAGFECGFVADDFTQWQPDDVVLVYKEVKAE